LTLYLLWSMVRSTLWAPAKRDAQQQAGEVDFRDTLAGFF